MCKFVVSTLVTSTIRVTATAITAYAMDKVNTKIMNRNGRSSNCNAALKGINKGMKKVPVQWEVQKKR